MKTYSLYLSTYSNINTPTNSANLASCTWNVNWTQIFGQRTGECNVRCRFNTLTAAGVTRADGVGTLRCSLNSQTSNGFNGLILGITETGVDGVNEFITLDTTQEGITCDIPIGNGSFTVQLFDLTETLLMTNVPPYQLILYFDVDDDLHPDLFNSKF
jgi:hypothetical protein